MTLYRLTSIRQRAERVKRKINFVLRDKVIEAALQMAEQEKGR